jgi:hypothetical protein
MKRRPRRGSGGPRSGESRRASALARGRVGASADDRLRWAVTFAQVDLDVLRAGEREALGHDLRALSPHNYAYGQRPEPLPEKEVRRLQERFHEAIQTVLGKPNRPLLLQLGSPTLVRVRIGRDGPYRPQLAWQTEKESDAIFGGFVGLLLDPEHRLRWCAECRGPYVVRKRQEYCSPVCSQRTRNRRKRKRKEEAR